MNKKASVEAVLSIHAVSGEVRRVTLVEEILKVGRDPKSHVVLDDERAARMHAVIEIASASDITLIDLGNDPGTRVNGKVVNKCKLTAGDEITIGNTRVVVESVRPVAPSFAPVNPFAAAAISIAPPIVAHNPFAATASPFASASAALATGPGLGFIDGDDGFAMLKSGPEVSADEVEIHDVASVEVMVLWDTNVLQVAHLTPPRAYVVGDEASGEACDYFVPSEALGSARAPIVVQRASGAALVVMPRAKGFLDVPGAGRKELIDLIADGTARPSSEIAGAHEVTLVPGAKARLAFEGSSLVFQVTAGRAAKSVPVGLLSSLETRALGFTGLSLLTHMALFAMFAFFMPPMSSEDNDKIDRDNLALMQKMVTASALAEHERMEDQAHDEKGGEQGAESTAAAAGEAGKLGKVDAPPAKKTYAVAGPRDNPNPSVAHKAEMEAAKNFGIIGIIATVGNSDPNAPSALWGTEGNQDRSAQGNMFFTDIGDAQGNGGLTLTGPGEGGGGKSGIIGLDNIGPYHLGHGRGGPGTDGIGRSRHPGGGTHVPRPNFPREVNVTTNGALPAEVIQRIVRQNFGRFQSCYQAGLRTNPSLQGRVATKFVIGPTGSVQMVADGGSDLADRSVVSCVVGAFGGLSFPAPQGGIVTVTYPIVFTPAN